MPEQDCPSSDQLRQYLSGQLKWEEIDGVALHVENCPPCEETVAALERESETVLSGLRRPQPGAYAADADYLRALPLVQKIGRGASLAGRGDSQRKDDAVPPIRRLREYELLEKLGEGGMGAVYKARHAKLDKIVAIKVLPAEKMKDPQAVARFEREMRAVGKLEHPNIVRAMDAGEVDGMHFLVMEYVQGCDLSQLVKRRGPLRVADACELIRQAALGLDEAHDRGMVHRDIKPSNLILSVGRSLRERKRRSRSEQPTVKILDMGLALLSGAHSPDAEELTTTGQMMGTLDYMAPEQGGDSKNVDIRADIYALGASLYRLLCGQVIYHGEKYGTPVQKMMALAVEPAPAVQERIDGIPDELAAIVHKMLEKDPAARYATPQEVADALAPFCRGADLSGLLTEDVSQRPAPDSALSATELGASSSELDTDPVGTGCQPVPESLVGTGCQPVPERRSKSAIAQIKPQPASGRGRLPVHTAIAGGAGLLGIVVVLAATIFFFRTPYGTLRVEIDDPDIEVKIKGEDIVLTGADKEPIKLKAGEHTLIVTRGDFTFETKQLTLKKSEAAVVKVELLPGKVQVVSAGEVIGSRALPATQGPVDQAAAGYALQFDGENDYVRIPLGDADVSGPLTIEFMVDADMRLDEGFTWLATLDADKRIEFDVHQEQGKREIELFRRRGETTWHDFLPVERELRGHVAIVWDGKQVNMFVNGKGTGHSYGEPPQAKNASNAKDAVLFLGAHGIDMSNKFDRYLHGKMDEVRISSVARYQKDFVPPTFGDRFSSDKHTLALYHCDEGSGELLHDSSGNNHHGKIVGAKWVKEDNSEIAPVIPPAQDFALRFDRESVVRVGALPIEPDVPVTVEVWIRPRSHENTCSLFTLFPLFLRYDCVRDSIAPRVSVQGMTFDEEGVGCPRARHETDLVLERWSHIATTLHPNGHMALFINGKLVDESRGRIDWQSVQQAAPRKFQLGDGWGKPPQGMKGMIGDLREVRVSTFVRYTKDFTPPRRFDKDQDTLALYHFDEGSGEVLHDSSGNGHDGKIVGAKWVRVNDNSNVIEPSSGGWHGWPADAPPLAFAPFNEDEAKEHQQAWAHYLGVPVEKEIVVGKDEDGKDVTLAMVLIPPGEFLMGSTAEEQARFLEEAKTANDQGLIDRIPNERPQHRVRITKPFYLGKYEVTQAQWQSVIGDNPSNFKDDPSHPVEQVSWEDVQPFLAKLNESSSSEKMTFALPTEAQWEYACRAGTTSAYSFSDDIADLPEYGWFHGNSGGKTHPVGELKPNAFGLYDIHGNVWEWCADWFAGDYYAKAPVDDPTGSSAGSGRVRRGGGCGRLPGSCRTAHRGNDSPDRRGSRLGFRLAASIDHQAIAQQPLEDPLPVGSHWLGERTYRRGAYQGQTARYELHVDEREGKNFKGHVFDNGMSRNRAPVEGEINGETLAWTETGRGNVLTIEAKLSGDQLQVTFHGRYGNGAANEGDGKLARVRPSSDE